MNRWKIVKRSVALERRVFSVHDLEYAHPKGISHNFSVINTPDWVNIVPVTHEGDFILVKQHRLGTDRITIETPGGLIDHGETPVQAAGCELLEETGFTSDQIVLMRSCPTNPAIMNNNIHFFIAYGCTLKSHQTLDREEDIEIMTASRDEVADMIHTGRIDHSIILTALFMYFLNISAGEKVQSQL
jgi:ADP-ribose pyrophosphatase